MKSFEHFKNAENPNKDITKLYMINLTFRGLRNTPLGTLESVLPNGCTLKPRLNLDNVVGPLYYKFLDLTNFCYPLELAITQLKLYLYITNTRI